MSARTTESIPLRSGGAVRLDPERERQELRAYLGEGYEEARLWEHRQRLEAELSRMGDEEALYRSSEEYVYDLTVFAMTKTKLPYLRDLARLVPPASRVLDYGCGIGSDGLSLLEAGYRVAFADFDNPSTRYLRWRLEHRGLSAPVYDLDRDAIPEDFDLAYAFDVIEHVDDPFAFLARLERHAHAVMVNVLEPFPGETALHRELPVTALLDHAGGRRLRLYRRYHERSHLVLYGREPARGLWRARARLSSWSGRARARWAARRAAG